MKILLIGNSYSYYWTDELWGLLNAAGYKNVRISNLYYSGCTFEKHWNWYLENAAEQTLFTVCGSARVEDRQAQHGVNLRHALEADQWDLISFQQSNRYASANDGGEAHRSSIQKHLPQLYELVHSKFPNAKYYWHQSWAHEIRQSDKTLRGLKDLPTQLAVSAVFRDVGKEVCEKYGFTRVPCGDAWETIRHDPMFYERGEGDAPIKSLHTRIYKSGAKNYEHIYNKDLSHDGDVGGGQYLNACVWFETLTKKSCVGNSFRPEYTHAISGNICRFTEEKTLALQNAAHQAVLNTYGEDFYE